MDFHEILYSSIFRKSAGKINLSLKSDKNNEYFTWKPTYIYDNISSSSSSDEKCIRQNCRENKNKYLMYSNFF